jgi:dienelactone hydrolase
MSRRMLASLCLALLAFATGAADPLSGTKPWEMPADPARAMVDGLHTFLDRETKASVGRRAAAWKRDLSSPEAYAKSVEPNRRRLETILGATGVRTKPVVLSYVAGPGLPVPLVANKHVNVTAVRWTVYPGFEAEGLLLEPTGEVKANVVAIPDAAQTPEQFAGIAPGLPAESQVARRLAEAGCRVLVPTLVDRGTEFSGSPLVRFTNLPHREWIYRMAYEAGRHIIGYEVDEVRAAVDWFAREGASRLPVGVMGYGEGGRIAYYAAALDTRIEAAWIAGAYGPREGTWAEPIDRNIFGFLEEFGDAEVATLVAPRALHVEDCIGPRVSGPPAAVGGRSDAASGRLEPTDVEEVMREYGRVRSVLAPDNVFSPDRDKILRRSNFVISGGSPLPLNAAGNSGRAFSELWGLQSGREQFAKTEIQISRPLAALIGKDPRPEADARARMGRLVKGMADYTQTLIRTSELRRDAYWSRADRSSLSAWEKSTEPYRAAFWEQLIGKFPPATEPMEVRTKPLYNEPRWVGYAVQIPVYPDVFASGVLLMPKDLKPGERRPVVVCQHGLEGTPGPVVDPKAKSPYNGFGAQLADRGYIVYAPQNPYIGHDRFRQLQRKANPLGKSLFSIIVAQHARTLEWLKARPEVDPSRIAFYGISYGGKTAMRVPAILKDYCLSICSADFNEWAVKCTNLDRQYSYMYTIEYDMYEFGLAERFNYAEMAALIAPRPFNVERGHGDGVAPDEWVGYEFAKVKRTYDGLGIGDRCELAVFNGGHQIDGKATFAFLAKHLNWPRGAQAP